MKTQVVDWTPTTLGPFLRLILTLTLECEAEAAQELQRPVDQEPHSRSPIATERQSGRQGVAPCLHTCHDLRTVPDALADLAQPQFVDRTRLVAGRNDAARSGLSGALRLAMSAAN